MMAVIHSEERGYTIYVVVYSDNRGYMMTEERYDIMMMAVVPNQLLKTRNE